MSAKQEIGNLDLSAITLDERGRVIIDDISTLDLISGGKGHGGDDQAGEIALNGLICKGHDDDTNIVFCR